MQVDVGRDRDVGQRVVVGAVALAQDGEAQVGSNGSRAASSIETPCRLVTWVAGSMTVAPEASFIDWRMKTAPTCRRGSRDLRVVGRRGLDHRQVELGAAASGPDCCRTRP